MAYYDSSPDQNMKHSSHFNGSEASNSFGSMRQPAPNHQMKYKIGSTGNNLGNVKPSSKSGNNTGVGEQPHSKEREQHYHLHLHLHQNHTYNNTCRKATPPSTPTSSTFSSVPPTPTTATTQSFSQPPTPPPRTPSPGSLHMFSFPSLNTQDDSTDMYSEEGNPSFEPPNKKRRFTTYMFDTAVDTVIFTGAVALTVYQILTGQKPTDLDSMDGSVDGVPTEPLRTATSKLSAEDYRPERRSSTSLPSGARPYHRAHMKRSSLAKSIAKPKIPMLGNITGSKSSPSKAVATGSVANGRRGSATEKAVEKGEDVYMRMEEKLKNLINEGQSALKSRIEICELEE